MEMKKENISSLKEKKMSENICCNVPLDGSIPYVTSCKNAVYRKRNVFFYTFFLFIMNQKKNRELSGYIHFDVFRCRISRYADLAPRIPYHICCDSTVRSLTAPFGFTLL